MFLFCSGMSVQGRTKDINHQLRRVKMENKKKYIGSDKLQHWTLYRFCEANSRKRWAVEVSRRLWNFMV